MNGIKAGDYIVHVTNDGECVNERPLIHCKDCKYYHMIKGCDNDDGMIMATADGFCSLAEMPHREPKS